MPKARTGKSKARIDAFDGIKDRANMDIDQGELTLSVKSPRLGTKILEIDNVSKAYGAQRYSIVLAINLQRESDLV